MAEQTTLLPEETLPTPRTRKILLDVIQPDDELIGAPPTSGLIASLDKFGLLQPIVVIEPEQSKTQIYQVVDGRRRVKAARKIHWDRIRCEVYPPGTSSVEVMAVIANQHRSENPLGDLKYIETLISNGATYYDIQVATGMPVAKIKKRLKLQNLIPEIRQKLQEGAVKVSTAEKIAGTLKTPMQQKEFLEAVNGHKITGKLLKEFRSVHAQEFFDQLPDELFDELFQDQTESSENVLTLVTSYAINQKNYHELQQYLSRKGKTLEVQLRAAVAIEVRIWQERMLEEENAGGND